MNGSPTGYQGRLDENTGANEFNAQAFLINQRLSRVRTIVQAKVVSVTGGGLSSPPTVDVMPLVSQLDGDNNAVPHGIVYGLPVHRMQAGKSAVICDPVVGDIGFLAVCDRDGSAVIATKAPAPPGSFRQFDLCDSVYLGAILGATPTQFVHFADDGISITSPTKVTITAPAIVLSGAVEIDGTASGPSGGAVTFAGDVVASGKSLATHEHGGVQTGSGNTGPPL